MLLAGLSPRTIFILDTGASPNLIRKNKLIFFISIDIKNALLLADITDGRVETLGSTEVLNRKIVLHVIPDKFPISQDGIFGSKFLRNASEIDFVKQIVTWHSIFSFTSRKVINIPARSNAIFHENVINHGIKTGYVPRLLVDKNIYLGDATVTNRNGKAYLRTFNIEDRDISVSVLVIELQEFDIFLES